MLTYAPCGGCCTGPLGQGERRGSWGGFALPDNAEAAKITSDFKDGLLKVHVPKNPAAAPQTVEIKVT
jgi:HSP20 family molecular chaperone IbpA